MPAASLERVNEFLTVKRLAMVGVSRRPWDFSRRLFAELRRRGYEVIPVNPKARELDGAPCYARVGDIQPPVEAALVMTPARATERVVRDCAEAGVRRVWLYRAVGRGAVSRAAVEFCEARGIQVIAGLCPYMFFPDASLIHRIHKRVLQIAGCYPPSQGGGTQSG